MTAAGQDQGSAPELPGYRHSYSGKVRDLYAPVDPQTGEPRTDAVLLVASDRVSAFDHVLTTPIPDKGRVLTALSLWWFERLEGIDNHVLAADGPAIPEAVAGRAVLVRRLSMLPVECIARAYLTGGGLVEYQQSGRISGVAVPPGLQDGSRLPEPIFTPSTKAPSGQHDEPITLAQVSALIGPDLATRADQLTRQILLRGNEIAASRGILIADTKVEFGIDPQGRPDAAGEPRLVLADEVLTPDSSRFWPADEWQPGRSQPSFDKQFVRDWLLSPASGWDRRSGQAPPPLPDDIVAATRDRYLEAYTRLTGRQLG